MVHVRVLKGKVGGATHAEGGHPEWPSEDWGGAVRADWWDSTQHDSEPINHTHKKREHESMRNNRTGSEQSLHDSCKQQTSHQEKKKNSCSVGN